MDFRRMLAVVMSSSAPTLYQLASSSQAFCIQISALCTKIIGDQAVGLKTILDELASAKTALSKDLAIVLGKFDDANSVRSTDLAIVLGKFDDANSVRSTDLAIVLGEFAKAKEQLDRIEQDLNASPPIDGIATAADVTLSGRGIISVTAGKKGPFFMATVVNTGGPLHFDVSHFVDDAGNPVTDTDPATYTSSDETVATVVNDPADMQDGIITLTKKNTAVGETCVITASFPAQPGGMPFKVTGNLIVIDPAAAGAQAVITGPGVVAGA